jgi:hypothetical protein
MICYLWFSLPSPHSYSSNTPHFPGHVSPTTTLQLQANPAFVHFMQKLLETTQVSQSVIVLSLHYIYRLKERNRLTAGQPGSEFRIAVAGLMMANKYLDEFVIPLCLIVVYGLIVDWSSQQYLHEQDVVGSFWNRSLRNQPDGTGISPGDRFQSLRWQIHLRIVAQSAERPHTSERQG